MQKAKAIEELGELYDKAVSEVGESNAMLFQTHQFMLEDLDYVEAIENMIQTQSVMQNMQSALPETISHRCLLPWMMTICVSVQLI